MKVETPQISWHGSESDHGRNAPLLSLSVLESGLAPDDDDVGGVSGTEKKRRYGTVLATAGNDGVVHLWRLSFRRDSNDDGRVRLVTDPTSKDASTQITHLASLTRHERSVNAVSFSPDGLHLATAGDGGTIAVHSVPLDRRGNGNGRHHWADVSKEKDLVCRLVNTTGGGSVAISGDGAGGGAALGGRCEDVLDLSWNPDSRSFAVASLDHSMLVFELDRKKGGWNCVRRCADHSHYVQGVAHDPLGVYVATQGADRTVRIYKKPRPRPEGNNGGAAGGGNGKGRGNNQRGLGRATTIKYWPSPDTPQRGRPPTTVGGAERKDGDDAPKAEAAEVPAGAAAAAAAPLDNITNGNPAPPPSKSASADPNTAANATNPAAATAPTAAQAGQQQQAGQQTQAPRRRHLFADESTVESFFRRLAWTADGAYLVAPSAGPSDWPSSGAGEEKDGEAGAKAEEERSFGTYLFARHRYDRPAAVLAGLAKPSVVVRPCPVLFELPKGRASSVDAAGATPAPADADEEEAAKENRHAPSPPSTTQTPPLSSSSSLPHRSVFAVLTLDTVLVYDTHHRHPLAQAGGLHYSGLTDAAWTSDGRRLLVTSSDGYVSVLSFGEGELGTELAVVPQASAAVPTPVTPAGTDGVVSRPTSVAPMAPLPPCPSGQSAALVAPQSKRAKTSASAAVDANAGGGGGAGKRRITPTLVSAASPLSARNDNRETRAIDSSSHQEMDSDETAVGSRHGKHCSDAEDGVVNRTLENKVTDLTLDHERPTSSPRQQQQPPKKKKKRISPTLLTPA